MIQSSTAPPGPTDGTTRQTEPWETTHKDGTTKHTEPWETTHKDGTTKHTEPWEKTTRHTEPWETTPTQHNNVPTTPAGTPKSLQRDFYVNKQTFNILGGLGGGAVAAIVISVLVVGGLAALLIVMLRNRDWDVKRLIPPRAAAVFSSQDNKSAFSNISYNTGTALIIVCVNDFLLRF